MGDWDPRSYLKFEGYRTRPSVDLVSNIRVAEPRTVIDLGCGPGNSTQVLRSRWPRARVVGLDSSAEMIAAARDNHPDQEWVVGDIAQSSGDSRFDVVFSNAALQWLDDHPQLVERLFSQVASGGALAIQVPAAMYSSLRGLIHEVADDAAWSDRMEKARAAITIEGPHVYYDVLAPLARSVDMWETVYYHVLESPAAIIEWISSTGLRPFLDALSSDDERERFTAMLLERVTDAYPPRSDGSVLFPFRRIFVVAYT
ncbi:MAG: methyltransferase domain-containing protein [Candidatus Eisenbacteria bacterium]|nr:methyltransferase domain-containing protein [Candidatus Eisenbacteria bacterium]